MNAEVFRFSRPLIGVCSAIVCLLLLPGVFRLVHFRDLTGNLPPWDMVIVFSLAALVFAAVAIRMARMRIIADTEGLRWRYLGKEKSACWDEVSDYFIVKNTQGSRTSVVKFTDGGRLQFDNQLAGQRRLELWIARHATRAKPSGWLMQSRAGTISGKLLCSYTRKQYRATLLLLAVLPGFFLLLGAVLPFIHDKDGSTMGWSGALVGIVPACLIGLLVIPAAHREHQKRFGERFEADEHGFTFFDAQQNAAYVPWTEVRHLRSVSSNLAQKWLLETAEASYPIFATLENHAALIYLAGIQPTLPVRVQRTNRGSLVSTEKTEGKRTFHYRTRANRGILGALLAVNLFPLWMGWTLIKASFLAPTSSELFPLLWLPIAMSTFLILWWAGALWRYKTLRIILDSEGVTQYHLLHQTRICYQDIARLISTASGSEQCVETETGERPIRWEIQIADVHELCRELEQRTGLFFSDGYSIPRPPAEADR